MMSDIGQVILSKSTELEGRLSAIRRHLHMYPELSFQEHETSEYICRILGEEGIDHISGVAGTGILGFIDGLAGQGPLVALRADMDALPVTEANEVHYASKRNGIMHACGHDAHVAMLAGAAIILKSIRESLRGKVMLIFQPGEEKAPGGAGIIIGSEAFRKNRPDIVIAQHVLPELETGTVGYKAGKYMASSDEIYITVHGKGGHAAMPRQTTDQILAASRMVVALKENINKEAAARDIPTVIGIGKIRGDGATNVIPETVEIAGTLRTFDEPWRSEAWKIIENACQTVASEHGVKAEVNIVRGYPVLVNDENLTRRAVKISEDLLGREKVKELPARMGSEDFAFFSQNFPSLYFRTGSGQEGKPAAMLHSPRFDIDEKAMVTGTANMCRLAAAFLENQI